MATDKVLEAHGLAIGYSDRTVLSGIELEVLPGTFTVLLGANGAGKSTLLRTLSGVQKPLSGQLSYKEADIEKMSRREKARHVAMVSTERRGGDAFSVRQAVELGRIPYATIFERLNGEHSCIVERAIGAVGLEAMAERRLGSLSDGERQKVMIAAALAQDTPFVILDEPTAFLDVASRIEVLKLLRRMADSGKAILLSTHDIAPSVAHADYLWVVDSVKHRLICGEKDMLINDGSINLAFQGRGITFDSEIGDFR